MLFASDKILKGVKEWAFERVSGECAHLLLQEGMLISSAFVAWSGESEDEKGQFLLPFHAHIKHWPRGSVKMETIPTFAMDMKNEDTFLSFDIESGSHQFYFYSDMRDYFLFHCQG